MLAGVKRPQPPRRKAQPPPFSRRIIVDSSLTNAPFVPSPQANASGSHFDLPPVAPSQTSPSHSVLPPVPPSQTNTSHFVLPPVRPQANTSHVVLPHAPAPSVPRISVPPPFVPPPFIPVPYVPPELEQPVLRPPPFIPPESDSGDNDAASVSFDSNTSPVRRSVKQVHSRKSARNVSPRLQRQVLPSSESLLDSTSLKRSSKRQQTVSSTDKTSPVPPASILLFANDDLLRVQTDPSANSSALSGEKRDIPTPQRTGGLPPPPSYPTSLSSSRTGSHPAPAKPLPSIPKRFDA